MNAHDAARNAKSAAATAIARVLTQPSVDRERLLKISRETASELHSPVPAIRHLLAAYRQAVEDGLTAERPDIERLLKKARVRSLSGVAVVTVLTKPFPCPGRCVYCPSEARMPKSYLSNEPAAMRALAADFDPVRQVSRRLRALADNGHPTDKVELIVKGGSWSAYPPEYQEEFVRGCFDACNGVRSASLEESHGRNETALHRIIGLTLETRPDLITPAEIARLRRLGCTRVELGVQSLDNRILELCGRGHDAEAVARATALLKDAGFKTDYHLMPQLPGSSPENDLEQMRRVFDDPHFRPDMIKIYPCTVLESAPLHEWWKDGRYVPYPNDRLKETLIGAKSEVPRYCRISRIIRDIPSTSVVSGNAVTSLRQDIQREMAARGLSCACLRCREVGRVALSRPEVMRAETEAFDDVYEASGGTEHFLSVEDAGRTAVFAFCRLRLPQDRRTALLRELHTYGNLVPISGREPDAAQHKGHGRQLMAEAERVAREAGCERMAVISGVGVRGYYRKLGYELEGTYMVKVLTTDGLGVG